MRFQFFNPSNDLRIANTFRRSQLKSRNLLAESANFYEVIEVKDEKLTESLRIFLEKGNDWERKPTSLPGVFIVKLPPFGRASTRLVVEINPVDASGKPTRRRGFIIRNYSELKDFRDLMTDEKLGGLLKSMDEVNPQAPEKPKPKREEEIIEI